MKAFILTFTVILFLSAIFFPIIEILGAFMDLVKMNNAILASSRGAMNQSLEEDPLRDVRIVISKDLYVENLKKNFSLMMGLDQDLKPIPSADRGFDEFSMDIIERRNGDSQNKYVRVNGGIEKFDSFEIEISTKYRFKTSLMRNFSHAFKKPVELRINRLQNIYLTN